MTTLSFHAAPEALVGRPTRVLIGRKADLLSDRARAWLPEGLPAAVWESMVGRGEAGDDGSARSTWLDGEPHLLWAGVLPEACSRHNTPSRAWAVTRLVQTAAPAGKVAVICLLADAGHAFATALAIARAAPTFHATSKRAECDLAVVLVGPDGALLEPSRLAIAAEAVRQASHLVDAPPSAFDTPAFVAAAREVARRVEVPCHVIEGEELARQGLNGLWGVGKAARGLPALVVLDHDPGPEATGHDAWIGKGIVYDTGGLSIKAKTSMPGMKSDMGGAAAVLAAFEAAVRLGARRRITAVLCIAENAVGPDATRPDDILTLYSGRTVEVNNTDAEGRLVLADGVAWVTRHRKADRLIDLATLTGAQSMATGKRHAALYCTDEALEDHAVEAGKLSGDLTHPLPYCPEFFRREFQSRVADMRNSVKDRSNAQSSCAGEFIRQHLTRYDAPWLHVDMAGPSMRDGRATGYGVGLLLALVGLTS